MRRRHIGCHLASEASVRERRFHNGTQKPRGTVNTVPRGFFAYVKADLDPYEFHRSLLCVFCMIPISFIHRKNSVSPP